MTFAELTIFLAVIIVVVALFASIFVVIWRRGSAPTPDHVPIRLGVILLGAIGLTCIGGLFYLSNTPDLSKGSEQSSGDAQTPGEAGLLQAQAQQGVTESVVNSTNEVVKNASTDAATLGVSNQIVGLLGTLAGASVAGIAGLLVGPGRTEQPPSSDGEGAGDGGTSPPTSPADRLRVWAKLRDEGIITDSDFNRMKERLLSEEVQKPSTDSVEAQKIAPPNREDTTRSQVRSTKPGDKADNGPPDIHPTAGQEEKSLTADKPGMEVSGLYRWKAPRPSPEREQLRLDVDRHYPQMVASGTIIESISSYAHWIANLSGSGPNTWTGNIWYTDTSPPGRSFPYTSVAINVTSRREATATFSGGGGAPRRRTLKFEGPYFHPVDFEFDFAEGEQPTLTVDTCAHPNRPATLPCENLSLLTVYRRAGFDVETSAGGTAPLAGAGPDAPWSDLEMHDAMQTYWSRFVAEPQWALWVFFASLAEDDPTLEPGNGKRLGGVMFDSIGPQHRQGSAIFNDSFIANPPAGDPNPDAWVRRMIFWAAAHEMGHAFNLAHSWDKAFELGHPGKPWIPLTDEPEARSFMNYPSRVSGGQTAFFSDFEYAFSDQELLFLRHAPARFVQQGNAAWFDHHGFQGVDTLAEQPLKLELRLNRQTPVFEFMEPVMPELKLTNTSSQPQLVDKSLLYRTDSIAVVLKKDGRPARRFVPYAQYCWLSETKALMPGESMYAPLFVAAGQNGWDVAEPGRYTVQVALHTEDQGDLVSNPLRLLVEPPRDEKKYEAERLAEDFFSEDVGRTLYFGGTRFLEKANDTLREVTERLGDRRVALHANAALGNALAGEYKQLNLGDKGKRRARPAAMAGGEITVRPPNVEEARKDLAAALTDKMDVAAASLGHIRYKGYVDRFSDLLAYLGEIQEAAQIQANLYDTLADRNVLDRVLEEIKARQQTYLGA